MVLSTYVGNLLAPSCFLDVLLTHGIVLDRAGVEHAQYVAKRHVTTEAIVSTPCRGKGALALYDIHFFM